MQEKALSIVKKLQENGHTAVLAGGYVRDHLLKRPSKDIDIATCATPERIKELFDHTIPVGESFGVVIVMIDGDAFEVATLRKDGSYSDGRKPDSVEFTNSLQEDSKRRDFTINSLYMLPDGQIIDFHRGQEHLNQGIIVAVGDPEDRILEDKLRMLRAVRFSAQLDFSIHIVLKNAIRVHSKSILDISWERITQELYKLLNVNSSNVSSGFELLSELGLLRYILPEVEVLKQVPQDSVYHPEGNAFIHSMLVLKEVCRQTLNVEARFAGLLHDIGKAKCIAWGIDDLGRIRIKAYGHDIAGAKLFKEEIVPRLKLSNDQADKIYYLIANHMKAHNVKQFKKSTLVDFLRSPYIEDVIDLQHADALGGLNKDKSNKDYYLEKLTELKTVIHGKPLVTGKFLESLEIPKGPLYSEIIKRAREAQDSGLINSEQEANRFVLDLVPTLI